MMEQNEAYALMAGVGGELSFVTVRGDKTHEGSDRSPPTRDLVAASSFGVQGRKRMPRQRRSSAINLLTFAPSTSPHVPPPPPHAIDRKWLRFLFEKELKNSDVGSLRRMVLPKKSAETHLPLLEAKEGILITMYDLDGQHVWNFKYRFWPNNNSRMYVLENTGEFVNVHGLQLGDYIMLYHDGQTQSLVSVLLFDCFGSLIANGTSFVYETTCSNDSPLDFLGGSMTNYPGGSVSNYSRFGALEGFGSVESLSLDDFC
ncbi:B3 domain-containing transcription factor FUS3 [Vitis vinifera]|uniref:B3 domain-containing transcription factor FUS3 n=1 Tax=Vitis vinifera TaxID=29760 RepID=A0A438EBW4_VITVI|nr:B3 domain-containing transcription factor FUS3 [Vitis vinifera]